MYKSQAQTDTLPSNTCIRLLGRHTFSEGLTTCILHVHRKQSEGLKRINGTVRESKKI